jgi:hypothetical protein
MSMRFSICCMRSSVLPIGPPEPIIMPMPPWPIFPIIGQPIMPACMPLAICMFSRIVSICSAMAFWRSSSVLALATRSS